MNSVTDLTKAIRESHGAGSIHLSSVPVRHTYGENRVWDGVVEVFMLTNHPKARTAYAWTEQPCGSEDSPTHITLLHLPPVGSPLTAVRVLYDT